MINARTFEALSKKLGALLPPGAENLKKDFEKNAKALLQNAFSRMQLVSREEFDAQCAVLARTREKLEALEAQLAELEQRLQQRAD